MDYSKSNEWLWLVDFSLVLETSTNTLKYNAALVLDETDVVIKFYQDIIPSFLDIEIKYTYKELVEILNNQELDWHIEYDI
jgi:hypothetical protein